MKVVDFKTIDLIDVKGKRVLVRNDFNVPLDKHQKITDLTRIEAALPTIKYLLERGAKIILCSHLGRPKGQKVPELSLKPIAQKLTEILSQKVIFIGETVHKKIEKIKEELKRGEILLLENLRFNKEEKKNKDSFAKKLSQNVDVYVNDAFGACHRAHASIDKITQYVPEAVAGFLLKKEIEALSAALYSPPEKYVVILGGAKVSGKIPVIKNLLAKASHILIGGAMAYTFLKARGEEIGSSKFEEEHLDLCKEFLEKSGKGNAEILLPVDHIAATKVEANITVRMINQGEKIPEGMMGLDIGMKTVTNYMEKLLDAQLIVWNGPMGVFEIDNFSGGTMEIGKAVANSDAFTIIGGGDSVAAVNKAGLADKMGHISTGGGASLDFLAGTPLPGVTVLNKLEE